MKTISDAVALFDQQRYQEAFSVFAEIYNCSEDSSEQQDAFAILNEAFYLPNIDELKENYEHNLALLKNYPFFWNKTFHTFEELSFLLFPVSDDLFYCYDKKEDRFSDEYAAKTDQNMRYFFEHLDKPLQVVDEDNFYNLTFLNDNVRASEDFAGDNHIYLLYTSLEPLERLMLAGDLEPILRQQKFVFLIGEDNWGKYPINFRKEFGIDYSMMQPQKLRIEEMQRICFWYKRGYCGTLLGLDALDHNCHIVMRFGGDLFYETSVQGYPLFQTNLPENIIRDTKRVYSLQEITALLNHSQIHWGVSDLREFIRWLKASFIDHFTIPELFRAYFIYKFYRDKSHTNPRIVPVILWEPHLNDVDIHNPLVLDFPYRIVLNSIRDPIITVGRIYQREGSIFITQTMLIGYSMHPELRKHYYGYRLEDMKQYPVETCRAICEVLNVPYDPNMLNADGECQGINGEPAVHGFDTAPLHRNVDAVLSAFDQCRLQIFFDSLLQHYGYPTFNFDECPMDGNDVAFLLKFPFKFEKDYVEKGKWQKISQEELRKQLFQSMVRVWQMGKRGELVFSKVIKPKFE